MTPQEKAKEIYHSIIKELLKTKYKINGVVINDLAKECAKIHVRGIIESNPQEPKDNISAIEFWKDVLKEIDKL